MKDNPDDPWTRLSARVNGADGRVPKGEQFRHLGVPRGDILHYLADNGSRTVQQISDGIGQISRAYDSARCCRRSVKKLVTMGFVQQSRNRLREGTRGRPRALFDITAQGLQKVEELNDA